MPPMMMKHDTDPAIEIADKLGPLDEIEIFNLQVLVAIYIRPKVTKSGIHLTDKTTEEDVYQGKVGLVVKMGPTAFKEEEQKWFKGVNVKVGDWVVFRPSDGWSIAVNGQPCRILDDMSIRGVVKRPDMVW